MAKGLWAKVLLTIFLAINFFSVIDFLFSGDTFKIMIALAAMLWTAIYGYFVWKDKVKKSSLSFFWHHLFVYVGASIAFVVIFLVIYFFIGLFLF